MASRSMSSYWGLQHLLLAVCCSAELATKVEEIASLHEAQRSAQSQINLYISDLQVWLG